MKSTPDVYLNSYTSQEMLDWKLTIPQDQLSQKVDIDPNHLSRIEVGRSFPSLDTLERLATIF